MISDLLKFIHRDAGRPSENAERPAFGRLVMPPAPAWSYPSGDPKLPREEAAHRFAAPSRSRLAQLSGLQPEVLRPVRLGHDDIGGMIAALGVAMFGAILLLLGTIR